MKEKLSLNLLLIAVLFTLPFGVQASKPANTKFTIVIDPGHGGNDPGASFQKIKEKDIVLSVAQKIGKFIGEEIPDASLVFTRKTDVFIPLHERAQTAIDNKADIFISLHANSCPNTSIKGPETYVLGMHKTEENLEVAKKENSVILIEADHNTRYEGFDPNSSESYIMFDLVQQQYFDQSINMAALVQERFRTHASRNDRGVKQAGFLVLRESSMPSVLVEVGYLSNPEEAKYLNSEKGQNELAWAICSAIKSYKQVFQNSEPVVADQQRQPAETTRTTAATAPETKPHAIETPVAPPPAKPAAGNTTGTNHAGPSGGSKVQPKQATAPTKPQPAATERRTAIRFSVQISAMRTQLELKPANFRGLANIRMIKQGETYRYYYGQADSYEEATRLKKEAQAEFPDAFVVAFEGEKTIPVPEAIEKLKR